MNQNEILNIAAQTERDGINFYRNAAATASNEMARRMFDSFAAEEQRHLDLVRSAMAMRRVKPAPSRLLAELKTIFSDISGETRDKLSATADDRKAIEFALEIERKSYEFYSEHQREAETSELAEVCAFLAREENQHFRLFSNMKEYLDRTEDWHMVEEGWMFDGG